MSEVKTGGETAPFRLPSLRWTWIVGAAVAGLLVLLGWQVARGFDETEALRAEVFRSYETRAELQRILSLHQDIETGQRGYLLTGDPAFLEPYERSASHIQETLNRLSRHWLAGSTLLPRVEILSQVSTQKRAFVEETIALARAGRIEAARTMVSGGRGKDLMDAVRAEIDAIDGHERRQLAARTVLADDARNSLQRRVLLLQVLLLVLLVGVTCFLARTHARWQRALLRERDLAARQEAIFEAARDGMITINASGSIESLNPAAARMFGYQAEELLRRDVGNLFEVAPDRGQVETFLKRLMARRGSSPSGRQEFVGRCKDGRLFPAEVSLSPVELAGATRFLAVLRDVTERKEIERMKTEFVSTVSHELRTPLTSIAGSLGLIKGGVAGELPDRALRLVEIAQSNSQRLVRLINDMLDIEKIESGRIAFNIQTLDVARLIDQAVQANQGFAEEHKARIAVDPVPAGAAILGDEDRVMQVLTNLISNAAKFSTDDGEVRIRVTALDRRYRISVSDDGPGIPDEFRARIFSKFAQADSSDTRQKGGTGLGLSIVREIVTRLGGSVSFDSEAGVGTTFHVDLPAAPVIAPPPPVAGTHELRRVDDGALPSVLHVDDDPDMLRIVASAFENQAEVHSTPSVVEARAALQRFRFDAVILDIGMADGDGLELIPLIRERQDAAVIVFTAQDADPDRLAGAELTLVKSRDSLDRLIDETRRLMANRNKEAGQ